MRTKEEIEKLAEQEYREFPTESKDVVRYFNRDINCHRKRKAFVKGYMVAIEELNNNQKEEKKYTNKDMFDFAKQTWEDLFNNETLTYNSFEEYFKDKFKRYN